MPGRDWHGVGELHVEESGPRMRREATIWSCECLNTLTHTQQHLLKYILYNMYIHIF